MSNAVTEADHNCSPSPNGARLRRLSSLDSASLCRCRPP